MNIDIENLIKQQVEELDIRQIVKEIIREQVSPTAKQEIKDFTKKKIGELINIEIEDALANGITTDDGWGKKDVYTSFEQLFKLEFKKRLNEQYSVQRQVKEIIEQKVTALFNQKKNEVYDKIANEYLAAAK